MKRIGSRCWRWLRGNIESTLGSRVYRLPVYFCRFPLFSLGRENENAVISGLLGVVFPFSPFSRFPCW